MCTARHKDKKIAMSPKLCKLCKGLYIFIPKLQISYLDIRVVSLLFLSTFFLSNSLLYKEFCCFREGRQESCWIQWDFYSCIVFMGKMYQNRLWVWRRYIIYYYCGRNYECSVLSGLKPVEKVNFCWIVLVFGLLVYILYYHNVNANIVCNSF